MQSIILRNIHWVCFLTQQYLAAKTALTRKPARDYSQRAHWWGCYIYIHPADGEKFALPILSSGEDEMMQGRLLLAASAIILALQAVSAHDGPTVRVHQGIMQGSYLNSRYGRKFAAFQGIPYAQPPTGELRFKVR
jgi:hypothetical protein